VLAKKGGSQSQLVNNFKDAEIRKRMFLLFFCVSSSGAVLFFCIQVYAAIFLKTSVQLPTEIVDKLSIGATLALFPLTIFSGWLSDRVGRKPVVISGLIFGAIFIYPAFAVFQYLGAKYIELNHLKELLGIEAILIMLSCTLALVVGPQTALLAELFPAKNRNSAATLPHNLAAGWIGGMLPLAVTWLNQSWGSDLAGLCYPILLLAGAAIIAFFYLPETGQINLEY